MLGNRLVLVMFRKMWVVKSLVKLCMMFIKVIIMFYVIMMVGN